MIRRVPLSNTPIRDAIDELVKLGYFIDENGKIYYYQKTDFQEYVLEIYPESGKIKLLFGTILSIKDDIKVKFELV